MSTSLKIAYFDCFSGISGNMILGAFVDIGVSASWLESKLLSMPTFKNKSFGILSSEKKRNGISSIHISVKTYENEESRNFEKIKLIISKSAFSSFVKEKSIAVFQKIASAESKIHLEKPNDVHFHEVGGIDAIVDVVGSFLCIENLRIDRIYASEIPLSRGFVRCFHGNLPLPAPATLAILKGVPVYGTNIKEEIVTPTGAAIISTIAESFGEIPEMYIEKTGYGAGTKNIRPGPNLLRIILGSEPEKSRRVTHEKIMVIEASVDDTNPEISGFVMEKLFEAGALDVCFAPVYMKKNRPGIILKILCKKEKLTELTDIVFKEGISIGIRYHEVAREILERKERIVHTEFGDLKVKEIVALDGNIRIEPEYEECKKKALELKLPLKRIYEGIREHFG